MFALTSCETRLFLTIALLGLLLSVSCASPHRQTRGRLSLSGGGSSAPNSGAGGCSGPAYTDRHDQTTGTLALTFQHAAGFNIGGSASLTRGTVKRRFEDEDVDPEPPRDYTLISGGVFAGFDFEHWGLDFGVSTANTTDGDLFPYIFPYLQARFGREKSDVYLGGAISLGSLDPAGHGRLFSLAMRLALPPTWHLEFGVGFGGLPVPDDDTIDLANLNDSASSQLFLQTRLELLPGLGLTLGGNVTPRTLDPAWNLHGGLAIEVGCGAWGMTCE